MKIESTPSCPLCADAGWIIYDLPVHHADFGKLQRCRCQADGDTARKVESLRRTSGLAALSYQTFDRFNSTIPGTEEPYQMCRDYAAQPSGILLLSGMTGCGKTHLAMAVGNALLEQGRSVYYDTVPRLLDKLKSAMLSGDYGKSYDQLLDELQTVDLLILDDLGVQTNTDRRAEMLYTIVNERYLYQRPLIVTTNLSIPSPKLEARLNSRLSDVVCVVKPNFGNIDVRTLDMVTRLAA